MIIEIGNPRGRIALYLDKEDAIALARLHHSSDRAVEELERAVEMAYPSPPPICSHCNRELHGYRGPRCRYCDGTAE